MGKKLIKNENGMAMVAVLMALLVLSLLGVAAIGMASSNLKVGLEEREFQGAYYIAEAGATFYMEDLRKEVLDIYDETDNHLEFFSDSRLVSRLSVTKKLDSDEYFHREYGSQPKAEIELKEIGSLNEGKTRHYLIESTGEVDGVVRKVIKEFTLEWKDKETRDLEREYAIFTYGDMVIKEGGIINGPVYSQGTFTMNNGTINSDKEYAVFSEGNILYTGGTINGLVYSQGTFEMTGGTINSDKEYAVFSEGNILLKGGTINGSIGTNSIEPESIKIENWPTIMDYYLRSDAGAKLVIIGNNSSWINSHCRNKIDLLSKVIMPDGPEFPEDKEDEIPEFPTFPNITYNSDSIQLGGQKEYTLSSPITYMPSIKMNGNGAYLKINYSDGDILMVDDFHINQGKIDLDGEGILNIYVREKIIINGYSSINYVETNSHEEKVKMAENLIIYIDDDVKPNDLTFGGGGHMYGSIYSKDLNLNFGNGFDFIGNIITLGDEIEILGGAHIDSHLVFAPNAKVEVYDGGKLYGQVIADELENYRGGEVIFDPERKSPKFPFPGGSVDEPGEIIMLEGPIREK